MLYRLFTPLFTLSCRMPIPWAIVHLVDRRALGRFIMTSQGPRQFRADCSGLRYLDPGEDHDVVRDAGDAISGSVWLGNDVASHYILRVAEHRLDQVGTPSRLVGQSAGVGDRGCRGLAGNREGGAADALWPEVPPARRRHSAALPRSAPSTGKGIVAVAR
jgi:hypothetical protein